MSATPILEMHNIAKSFGQFYALKGVMVPDWLVTDPGRLTTKDILQERNIEVRRIMLDVFGPEKYLRKINARCISRDDFGSLYRADFQGDEPLVMVSVKTSTPEEDHSWKTYHLRVPPTITTAREAVAWSFNMAAEEYCPALET